MIASRTRPRIQSPPPPSVEPAAESAPGALSASLAETGCPCCFAGTVDPAGFGCTGLAVEVTGAAGAPAAGLTEILCSVAVSAPPSFASACCAAGESVAAGCVDPPPTAVDPVAVGTCSMYSEMLEGAGCPAAPATPAGANNTAARNAAPPFESQLMATVRLAAVSDGARSGAAARGLRASALVAVAVGAATFWLGFEDGAYGLTTWAAAGIAVWWTVGLACAGVLPALRPTAAARAFGVALALLTLFSLLSVLWAHDAELAYAAAGRTAVYLGLFALTVSLVNRDAVPRWLDGLALGIVALVLLALASRFFPSLDLGRAGASVLPAVVTRLSYPLGYWNGLAIMAALAVAPLLHAATGARTLAVRAAAVAPIPALAAVVYLASSRGGALVAVAAAVVFVACSGRGWAASGAALCGLVGSAVAVLSLRSTHEVLTERATGDLPVPVAHGTEAAVLICLAALVAAGTWLGLQLIARRLSAPSRAVTRGVVGGLVLLAIIGVALSHPVAHFHAFKRPPLAPSASGFTVSHLLSGSGSGRWQFWSAALDEWRSAKLAGGGAGSFAGWWAEHRTIGLSTQEAHSIFFQALGELGLIGFALVAFIWIGGPALAIVRSRRLEPADRAAAAAAAATAAAFAVGGAIDWIWRLPAVGAVGVVALALSFASPAAPERIRAGGLRIAAAACSLLVVAFLLVPLVATLALHRSASAAARGELGSAVSDALRARALEPWASSPLVQLALLDEARGRLAAAQVWIDRARRADGADWQIRLVAARIETKRGDIVAARRDLGAMRRLNPLSPLLTP